MDFAPNYYAMGKDHEIDFVIQKESLIVPIEAKAGTHKRATSFKKYIRERNPETAIRFSTNGYRKDGNITNIPLYLVSKTAELLK